MISDAGAKEAASDHNAAPRRTGAHAPSRLGNQKREVKNSWMLGPSLLVGQAGWATTCTLIFGTVLDRRYCLHMIGRHFLLMYELS